MQVNYDDLEMAFEFASFDSFGESQAYVCLVSGKVYLDSDAIDEELPEDLYEEGKYLVIPSKRDLGLGKRLALEFVEIHLPGDIESARSYFRSRGAYSKVSANKSAPWHAPVFVIYWTVFTMFQGSNASSFSSVSASAISDSTRVR